MFMVFKVIASLFFFNRYFPNMGVDEKGDLRDILRLLDDHVQSRYNSYKKAFLQLDVVRFMLNL